MAKVKKAQNGTSYFKQKAADWEADMKSSGNPLYSFDIGKGRAFSFGKKAPQKIVVDTTGLASGKKAMFKGYKETMFNKPGKENVKSYGYLHRQEIKDQLGKKKRGGKIAAKQLGRMKTTIGNKSFAKSKKK